MPRQFVRNYPDHVAKRSIVCEYFYLGKLVAKTSASSLERALRRVPRNIVRYGASKVVITTRKHGDVLATVKARLTRDWHYIDMKVWR